MEYIDLIRGMLDEIEHCEGGKMHSAAQKLCETVQAQKSIYIFGASHAGILSEELFYRAGGLMVITPIFGEDLSLTSQPISHTSRMERLEGYGRILAHRVDFQPGDVLIVHSVSGRNPVSIDLALEAKAAGAYIICLTNMTYTTQVTSKHSSGKLLYETADLVLDNHGVKGDAVCQIEDLPQKVAPTSTVTGAVILNTIVSETVRLLKAGGMERPPVFYSANLDGGDELNRKLFAEYKDSIHYKL